MHIDLRVIRCRSVHRVLRVGAMLFACVESACAPGTPRIDGAPGAPPSPSVPWTVPEAVRTPPPPAAPPVAPQASAALQADSANEQGAQDLSLTDVIDLALRNNPATRESWATALAAADQYGASKGALFPNVNGNVQLARSGSSAGSTSNGVNGTTGTGLGNTGTGIGLATDSTGTGRTSTGSGGASSTRTQLAPSVSLSYLVFDFGGRAGTIEGAKQQAIAADLNHNATVQNVVLQVESALFSYIATRAQRDAQLVSVTEARADTAAAEARLRVGVGTLEEVLQTRTALAQALFQLATNEGDLLDAHATLATTMGLQANARFEVPNVTAGATVSTVAATVDTLINRAIVARPELAESRAQAAALAADIRVARSAGYPALTLSSTGSYTRELQGGGTSGRNYSLVLGLQIPIFNGFARQYQLRAAQADYQAGLARVTSTLQQITLEVYTSYAAVQTSVQRVQAATELLASAQQSADVAVGRYREGVGTIVDVLLARSSLETARGEDIQAQWEWRTALAQLAHDTGSLDTAGRPNVLLGPP
ncbi:MAG TPA: TolC family protein [Gemmatimonadaceae bacterium]|jgi:outer membrane protein TolC